VALLVANGELSWLRFGMDTGKSRRKPSGAARAWFLERISRGAVRGQEGISHAG